MTAVEIPDSSPFGLHTLPYGVFSTGGEPPRVGVRLGDTVIDLAVLLGDTEGGDAFAAPTLNPFLAQGRPQWDAVRARIVERVTADLPAAVLHPLRDVQLHLPFQVGDYVDFYASPLLPNWKHLPVGYHGRGGTVVVSGTDVIRPCGQRKAPADAAPSFGPSQRLDIEAELGFVIGTGSPLGTRIAVDAFDQHVFGAVLVNDWSARDLQAWEYQPLGPHLGKSFATSISAWVVPLAALQHARVPLPGQDPEPLPYLRGEQDWGLDVDLVVEWNGAEVSRPPYRDMYWSPAQMLAHLTVNGASTRPGDLFASGTVSGPEKHQRGAFIELTWGGQEPVTVKGEQRTFLQDGDAVTITATAPGPDGTRIGFGEVTGTISAVRQVP